MQVLPRQWTVPLNRNSRLWFRETPAGASSAENGRPYRWRKSPAGTEPKASAKRATSRDASVIISVLAFFIMVMPSAFAQVIYSITDLGTLPGGSYSSAYAINSNGQVVGSSDTAAGALHAFLYSDGAMVDLGSVIATNSIANGINDAGQVVGTCFDSGFAWDEGFSFLYSGGSISYLGALGGWSIYANGYSQANGITPLA